MHAKDLLENGQPFMTHMLSAAETAAEFGLDETSVIIALIHNTYEKSTHNSIPDRPKNRKIAEKKFGKEIISLIDLLSKIWEIEEKNEDTEAELLTKILIANINKPEIIILNLLLKLDWLKNRYCPESHLKQFAKSALSIYVPLAHKVGVYSVKAMLEDTAFEVLNPEKYMETKTLMEKYKRKLEEEIQNAIKILFEELEKKGIKAKIYSRAKNIYSTYQKMQKKSKPISEIYDLSAIRVITNRVSECYAVSGIINSLWPSIPGEFDDYIAKPKPNLYQSIHMSVVGPHGKPLEIQIRTNEMHDIAEYGVASHWAYKGHKKTNMDFRLLLMKQFLDWKDELQLSYSPSVDFNIGGEKIFALTPKGKIIELPKDSTPVDFAYEVHSELGEKCEKAKVNDALVPLNYKLKNLDIVEIITSKDRKPSLGWLSFVKSEKARGKLNQFFDIVLKKNRKEKKEVCMLVRESDPKIKLAGCCKPLPGDEITAIHTTKRKISVHKKGCPQIEAKNSSERISVDWGQKHLKNQVTEIAVLGKPNNELMISLLKKFNEANALLLNAKAMEKENMIKITFQIKAENLAHLQDIMEKAKEVPGVTLVSRV